MATKATTKAVTKPWAFLAYIAGDNNLSDNGLEDIEEMCTVGASKGVHAGVQIDTYGEFDGVIRYEITEPDWTGEAHRTVIRRLVEKNSGSPTVLAEFLKWGLKRYPAQHALVVVWNHGSGFRNPRLAKDIAFDDFGDSLDIPELEKALRRGGITNGRKLGILGFDACLMNMLEIAHHLSDQVEVLVGSQQTEPADGWPYDRVLAAMKAPISVEALGKRIVEAYIADYDNQGISDVTQSAILLSKTPAAVKALGELGGALRARLPGGRTDISARRVKIQSYEMADYVDLVHLAEAMKSLVPQQASAVIRAVRDCVIAEGHAGQAVKHSNGLSVWFPSDAALYAAYRGKYLRLKCTTAAPGWINFLDAYFA